MVGSGSSQKARLRTSPASSKNARLQAVPAPAKKTFGSGQLWLRESICSNTRWDALACFLHKKTSQMSMIRGTNNCVAHQNSPRQYFALIEHKNWLPHTAKSETSEHGAAFKEIFLCYWVQSTKFFGQLTSWPVCFIFHPPPPPPPLFSLPYTICTCLSSLISFISSSLSESSDKW